MNQVKFLFIQMFEVCCFILQMILEPYKKHFSCLVSIAITFIFSFHFASGQTSFQEEITRIKFYDKLFYLIEGTAFSDTVKENTFDRLPFHYKDSLSPEVWLLSKNSAGMSVRFLTNSTVIKVKWELSVYTGSMPHMAATGSMGIDLYCMQNGNWQFVNTGIPKAKINESLLVANMNGEWHEFRVFLPLYSGIKNLEIGIDSLSEIKKANRSEKKPIVFYGTSITQGACASRPGMAYTNIVSRKLNIDCLNFGFSGQGVMDLEMAKIISQSDASYYFIDCIPNMTTDQIKKNTLPFLTQIRKTQPETPIVLMEGLLPEETYFNQQKKFILTAKNPSLEDEFQKAVDAGIKNIIYMSAEELNMQNHESTVDGIHFTDLGFMKFSDCIIEKLKKIKK